MLAQRNKALMQGCHRDLHQEINLREDQKKTKRSKKLRIQAQVRMKKMKIRMIIDNLRALAVNKAKVKHNLLSRPKRKKVVLDRKLKKVKFKNQDLELKVRIKIR